MFRFKLQALPFHPYGSSCPVHSVLTSAIVLNLIPHFVLHLIKAFHWLLIPCFRSKRAWPRLKCFPSPVLSSESSIVRRLIFDPFGRPLNFSLPPQWPSFLPTVSLQWYFLIRVRYSVAGLIQTQALHLSPPFRQRPCPTFQRGRDTARSSCN